MADVTNVCEKRNNSPVERDRQEPVITGRRRRPRRDAEQNRQRLLRVAASAMMRDGVNVPLATIAAEAGVGVGTLYRSYPNRRVLLQALEYRAYGLLNEILDELIQHRGSGLEAIEQFLAGTLAIRDQLVLPLHGAPPLTSPEAVDARRTINQRLDALIERGHVDGSIRADVNATDLIMFSALITQPVWRSPDSDRITLRQIAIVVNGMSVSGPFDLPGPAVTRENIEEAFVLRDWRQEPR